MHTHTAAAVTTRRRASVGLAAMTAALMLLFPGLAVADEVTNDVTSTADGRILAVEAGSSVTVTYGIQNKNSNNSDGLDPQNSCNPADGTPLTITPTGLPSGVTAPAATATTCSETAASITFTAASTTTPDDYPIGHDLFDARTTNPVGTYDNLANFTLRVTAAPVVNTPPVLSLPANISIEGNTLGGATVTYSATASDAEDAGPLTPSCSPASGSVFPVGTTTVHCSVTDSGGLTDSGSFTVTVEDTTAPTLAGMPTNRTAVFDSSLAGAVVTWTDPTAHDIVDGPLTPTCAPASGSLFGLGATTVTCSATDDAGNTGPQSFTVTVVYTSTGILQPINVNGTSVFKLGSTIPVKVQLTGASAGYSAANLTISLVRLSTGTDGTVNETVTSTSAHTGTALRYDPANDQYIFNLGTKGLSEGRYQVTVTLDDGTTRSSEFQLRR